MTTLSAPARAVLVLLIGWQGVVTLFAPPRYILPAPADVAVVMWRQGAYLADHALVTLAEIMVGFTAGAGLGVAAALLAAAMPRLGGVIWPVLIVAQAFPVFVIAPLVVLWFGFGMASKVAMTMLIIFFPVASSFADGLRRIDRDILDAASLTPATRLQTLLHIRIPLALPALVSGLRVAAPLAPLGAVIGEWVGSSAGLGFVMIQANARLQTDIMFAAMAIVALLALALRGIVNAIAPFVAPWAHEE